MCFGSSCGRCPSRGGVQGSYMRRCGLALQETVVGGQPQPSDPGRCRAAAADPTVGLTVSRDPAREAPRPGWPPLDRALPRSPGSTATRGSPGFLRWARDIDRERERVMEKRWWDRCVRVGRWPYVERERDTAGSRR
jgi:hypothetical protein